MIADETVGAQIVGGDEIAMIVDETADETCRWGRNGYDCR